MAPPSPDPSFFCFTCLFLVVYLSFVFVVLATSPVSKPSLFFVVFVCLTFVVVVFIGGGVLFFSCLGCISCFAFSL